MTDRIPGRAAFIACGLPRGPGHAHHEADYQAVCIYADGGCALELSNSQHLDDWPDGFQCIPGPGIWIWEGDIIWSGGASIPEWEADAHGAGEWRRPTTPEWFAIGRGLPPFPLRASLVYFAECPIAATGRYQRAQLGAGWYWFDLDRVENADGPYCFREVFATKELAVANATGRGYVVVPDGGTS